MSDNAIISQSAVPTDNNDLKNKKYVDDNRKKLKDVADGNINMGFYNIKQTVVPTDNSDVINKSYVDTKIVSFDTKIFDFSIGADGYYYPLGNPFTPLYYYNPNNTTRINTDRMFVGSSISDANLKNRGFDMYVRAYKQDGTFKLIALVRVSLSISNIKYDCIAPQRSYNRLYTIDDSVTLETLLGKDFSQYKLFVICVQSFGNTPQINYKFKLQVSLVNF